MAIDIQILYFSDLLPKKYPTDADNLFAALEKYHVQYALIKGAKDVWIRDFMPVQRYHPTQSPLVAFKYEPAYLKKQCQLQADSLCDIGHDLPPVGSWCPPNSFNKSDIHLEGSSVLISSDRNKALVSDRIFAENSQYEQAALVRELTELLSAEIIIIPVQKSNITGHIDKHIRFLDRQTVLYCPSRGVGQGLPSLLQNRGLDVNEFPLTAAKGRGATGCYLNYLETKKAVFLPVFGAEQDSAALAAAKQIFQKPVEPVLIPHIAAAGGGLRRISWEMLA